MKNKLILVGGYSAAGKTTFARRLSQELNIPCFERDTIDETLCDALGSESNVVKMRSEVAAFALMLHIAERLLQAKKPCILENVFVLDDLDNIKILLEKYDCECLLFILKGSPDVMFDRYVERDKSGERHWIHYRAENGNNDGIPKSWFVNNMPEIYRLEEAEVGQKIIVDTTSFDKINYDDLIAAAKRFIMYN